MAIHWKLILDITVVTSIMAALAFLSLVKQKEEHLYTNMALLSTLCFVYWQYFSVIRKRDMIKWSRRNLSSKRPCVTHFKRALKKLLTAGLPYWSLLYLYIAIICMFFLFPVAIIGVTAFYEDDSTPLLCMIFISIDCLYLITVFKYTGRFKMRFRVKFHSGSLLMFVGMYLVFTNFGTLGHLIGGWLTALGLSFYYDICKKYLSGTNIRIDIQVAPVNGNADVGMNSFTSFLERFRRRVWYMVVNNHV